MEEKFIRMNRIELAQALRLFARFGVECTTRNVSGNSYT